jgi:flagellar biogenesis protein FliO
MVLMRNKRGKRTFMRLRKSAPILRLISIMIALFAILLMAVQAQAAYPPVQPSNSASAPAIALPAMTINASSPGAEPSTSRTEIQQKTPAASTPSPSSDGKGQPGVKAGKGEEGTWLDEAEIGSPRDKAYQKNFFKRIWLTIFSLVVVTIIIVAIMRFLYSNQGILPVMPAQNKFIKVIERQLLQPQKALYLVDIAGKCALIGITESKIEYIMEVDSEKVKEKAAEIEASKPAAFDEKYLPKHLSFLFGWMKAKK